MFVWWGTRSKVRPVRGGRKERMQCPACGELATFRECEAEEAVTLFSVVSLAEDRETVYRCGECGELFDLVETPDRGTPSRAAAPSPGPDRDIARRLAAAELDAARRAERERRDVARAEARRAATVEAELAALKRKLGRG
jgi:hypothetical protein